MAHESSSSAELAALSRIPEGILQYLRAASSDAYPTYSRRGEGPYLWDADGKRYVDWVMGKGAVTLGHAYSPVDRAAAEAATRGVNLGLCPLEAVLLAEKMAQLAPSAEKSTFVKNGSDAVNSALRLARVFTGRELVLSCGYHGWHDAFLPEVFTKAGVPAAARHVIDFGYSLERLERLLDAHGRDVAAVMVTPEPSFFGAEFLRRIERLVKSAGALLIVDEVRCGLHLADGGAHALYGVDVDLVTFSKGFANGHPLSILSGRAEVMNASADTYIFGTYFYEACAMAAALVAIDESNRLGSVDHMWSIGQTLMSMLDAVFDDEGIPARCLGPAPMFHILFEDEPAEDLFFTAAAQHGVLFFAEDNQTTSLAHGDEQIQSTVAACTEAARLVRRECYGDRKVRRQEISPQAFARYEARRMIEPGLGEPGLIENAGSQEAWA